MNGSSNRHMTSAIHNTDNIYHFSGVEHGNDVKRECFFSFFFFMRKLKSLMCGFNVYQVSSIGQNKNLQNCVLITREKEFPCDLLLKASFLFLRSFSTKLMRDHLMKAVVDLACTPSTTVLYTRLTTVFLKFRTICFQTVLKIYYT